MLTAKQIRILVVSTLSLGLMVWLLNYSRPLVYAVSGSRQLKQSEIQTALASPLNEGKFPDSLWFELPGGGFQKISVEYTLDERLQNKMDWLFRRWKPDYGAFAAVDAETGEVLVLSSYAREDHTLGNLALRASYPAASIFKVVTAAAAINERAQY